MSARFVSLCVLVIIWSVSAGLPCVPAEAMAGEPASPAATDAVTQAQLDAALSQFEQRIIRKIEALAAPPAAPQGSGSAAAAEPERTGPVTREEINRLWKAVEDNSAHLERKQEEIQQVQDLVANNSVTLDQVTRTEGGSSTLAVKRLMDTNGAFREEMKAAVEKSLDRRGELRVVNKMATSQLLRINQRDERIPPNTTRIFKEPVGTVTTELVGYEGPKHLTITAPTYVQRLVIAPSRQPTRIVEAPLLSDPFVWHYEPVWHYDPFTGAWWSGLP